MASNKVTPTEKGGVTSVLELGGTEGLSQSPNINMNNSNSSGNSPLSSSPQSKAVRPLDIDIQKEGSYYNESLLDNANNGARSKTKKLKQSQLMCTNRGLSLNQIDNNPQFGRDTANITLHFTDQIRTNNSDSTMGKPKPKPKGGNSQFGKDTTNITLHFTDQTGTNDSDSTMSKPKPKPKGMVAKPLLVRSSSLDTQYSNSSRSVKPLDLCEQQQQQFVCFMCSAAKPSAYQLQVHINTDHFDYLETKPKDDPSSSTACFICKRQLSSLSELQIHINHDHFDSPVKPVSGTDDVMSQAMATTTVTVPASRADADNKAAVSIDSSVGQFALTKDERNDRLIAETLQKQFDEESEFRKLQELYGMTECGNYKKQFHSNVSEAVLRGQISCYDYHRYTTQLSESQLTGIDDGLSCTKGIIQTVQEYYKHHSHKKDVWLCSDIDHYGGSFGDTGWGCGYRNLQMMLSCLGREPVYQNLLSDAYKARNGLVASIKRLQQLIETAWQCGFDRQGAEQLGNKLVDTRKWIGATEIVAMLSSLRLKCHLLDVHSQSGHSETHPRMFQWIRDYFKRKDHQQFRSPLYLQYQGHSQTVIGVEVSRQTGAITLLIVDPACTKSSMKKLKAQPTPATMQPLRKYLSNLTKDQYQIVAVVGTLTEHEWLRSKVLKSEKLT
ncbi:zinc finger-containing ubiquitin peptidase 1-like [Argonauta hians]